MEHEKGKVSYSKAELEEKLQPVAMKFNKDDCPPDCDIVQVILPWLDNANDCIEVYIIRDGNGRISLSFD